MRKQTLFKRSFLFLWFAQVFSQLAFNMMNFILIIFVFDQTSSNTIVSGLVISFTLPALFLGMLAGVYVDRRNKKNILLLTNISRAFLTSLFYLAMRNIPLVFGLSFLISAATQFFVPAEASSIPRVVGKKFLISANSLFAITLFASIFAGYILAGPVLKILGFANAFLFSGLLYFLAAFFISLLPSLGNEQPVNLNDFLRNNSMGRAVIKIKEVYQLLRKVKNVLFAIVFLSVSQGIVIVLATLLPGYAKTVLGIETTDISLIILVPATLGMILGSLILANIGRKIPEQLLINMGIISSGIILLVLPRLSLFLAKRFLEIDIIHLVMVLFFILGLANALIMVISNATIQGDTQKHFIGSVYGVVTTLSAAFSLFPVIIVGGLADILGVKTVLTSIAIMILLLGIVKSYKDYVF